MCSTKLARFWTLHSITCLVLGLTRYCLVLYHCHKERELTTTKTMTTLWPRSQRTGGNTILQKTLHPKFFHLIYQWSYLQQCKGHSYRFQMSAPGRVGYEVGSGRPFMLIPYYWNSSSLACCIAVILVSWFEGIVQ